MAWSGGRLCALAALAVVLLASLGSAQTPTVAGGSSALAGPGLSRVLAPGIVQALPAGPEPSSPPSSAAASGPNWTIQELDSDPDSGHEVAAYAIDPSTVIILHKRFHDIDPQNEYAPADLVAVRTTDGGATWSQTVLDSDAPERVGVIDGSIAVSGSGDDVWAVYHERASGAFADMRLLYAHSADRGATWSTGLLVDGFGGDYNGVAADGAGVLASWHGEGPGNEGAWAGLSTDGGQTWSTTPVALGSGNGYYTSAAAAGGNLHVGHADGDGAFRVASSQGGPWTDQTVAAVPNHAIGLGADTAAWTGQSVVAAYEDFDWSLGVSTVYASVSQDGGLTWVPTALQQAGLVGWNTDVDAVGDGQALLSYWWGEPGESRETGRARLARTSDGGASWSVETVPEAGYVTQVLDVAGADLETPFVAYQVWDPDTGAKTLHVAHRGAAPPPPPPPPPSNATLLVHVDVDLGTLGDHRQVDVPVVLDAAYGHLQVTTSCPSSFGEAALLSGGHPLQSAAIACTLGRQTASLPPTLPEGNYLLQVAAAGSGHFVVEVTGTRVP